MAARKSTRNQKPAKHKKAPAKPKKAARKTIKKPAKAKQTLAKPKKKKTKKAPALAVVEITETVAVSPMPVPDSKEEALAWFGNLSNRVTSANAVELQKLVSEARTYDLVGLGEVLENDEQVLELNRAANAVIEAALEVVGANSPEGFQLQVLRDIINDS